MTAGTQAGPLAGTGVLVTRPAHQAGSLCRLVEAAGGHAVRFPVLEISATLPQASAALLARLASFDLAIFISANAVEHGLAAARAHGPWPPGLERAAIGRATAAALEAQGLPPAICPAGPFDSETLLLHPDLQAVAGQRIVIFRGVGGRELLAETLRARGAEVAYAEVYRRRRPSADPAPLLARWRAGAIDIVVVTSREGLANLWRLLGPEGQPLLRATQLVAASDRVLQLAAELAIRPTPVVAREASDAGLLEAVIACRRLLRTTREQ